MLHRALYASVGALLIAALLPGCATERGDASLERPELRAAEARYAAIEAQRRAGADLTEEEVLHLAYLQRLRMGLGGPYRLIETALLDPRLSVAGRHTIANRLFAGVLRREAYQMHVHALGPIAPAGLQSASVAAAHAALIDATIKTASDPRAGEQAVRLAYRIAASERSVNTEALTTVTSFAALLRDRELALRDARRLIAEARQQSVQAISLIPVWRVARRFESESPPGVLRTGNIEAEAVVIANNLVAQLRSTTRTATVIEGDVASSDVAGLDVSSARRVLVLDRGRPPSTPVTITLDRYRAVLRRDGASSMLGASTEEELAAYFALLPRPANRSALDAVLEVAVGLRAYAQERPWHPGFASPSAEDLKRRYGIRAVAFDRDVPANWRPYYRRMVADALADLERVIPDLDVEGLSVRIGRSSTSALAPLATHAPASRRIVLSPRTGAGVLAHEIAHDLDARIARTRFGLTGAYGTDAAIQRDPSDRFAAAVLGLPSPAARVRGDAALLARYARRPTERFARAFESYVALSLAGMGRSNGFLTSYQDEAVTGHGAALVPATRSPGAAAILPVLAEVSSPGSAASDFAATWAAARAASPSELVHEMLDAELPSTEANGGDARSPAPPGFGATPETLGASSASPARGVAPEATRAHARAIEAVLSRIQEGRNGDVASNPFRGLGPAGEEALARLLSAAAEARLRGGSGT